MAHADRLDLLDRSRVSVSARDCVSTAARAALTIYASPPSFPVGGLPTGEVPLRMAAVKAAQAQSTSAARENARREAMREAYAASWKEAFSPLRNLLTTGLMLWMAGNSVQVFSVMSAVTALTMQLQGLFAVRPRFGAILKANADLQGRLVPQAIVYALLYGVGVGLALHKCDVLGFLPTEESDWIGLLPSEHVEPSVLGGVTF